MKTQLISLVGQTASGKTSAALEVSQTLLEDQLAEGVDIISVDSKQVYAALPIITGADIPVGFAEHAFSELSFACQKMGSIAIHGVGILSADQDWSFPQFRSFAHEVVSWSFSRQRVPLLVGGSGLYHTQLLQEAPAQLVKPDMELRHELATAAVVDLQHRLVQLDADRLARMNNSDSNNPRRLIRAIEQAREGDAHMSVLKEDHAYQQQYVGLQFSLSDLEHRIQQRVEERIAAGALDEVRQLFLKEKVAETAASALGVADIHSYLSGSSSLEVLQQNWVTHELQYAKRQLTWWRQHAIDWFNLSHGATKKDVVQHIVQLLAQ